MAVNPARPISEMGATSILRAVPRQGEDLGRRLQHYLSAGQVGRYFRAAEWQGRARELLKIDLDLGKVMDEVEAINTGDLLTQAYGMIHDLHDRMFLRFGMKPIFTHFYNLPEFQGLPGKGNVRENRYRPAPGRNTGGGDQCRRRATGYNAAQASRKLAFSCARH